MSEANNVCGGYDIIVIGGGHAGCEAALASARLGCRTAMFAINLDSIAMMPCNPSIGGTSKGHLVREIDALGGEMGRNIDKTYIQSRMLNTGKGPAVHSLRAQADKAKYSQEMKKVLEAEPNLFIIQTEAVDIRRVDSATDNNSNGGSVQDSGRQGSGGNGIKLEVVTITGAVYPAKAVVLCTGTYLRARCLCGETVIHSGPGGMKASTELARSLERLGVTLFRFKTGTPARILRDSIDFSKMQREDGDQNIVPFSFESNHNDIMREQVPCYLTYTNERTHAVIRANLSRSPMYQGVIEGTGTRYCPSIEDKIVRFADKDKHQVFIEPEGENTQEMYVQGMSTSLPEDVQLEMYRTVPGLENCHIMRSAYAIEYDCIDAGQLRLSLEFKEIPGLFCAGQFNGSSGYEEAAAQGIMAGINAARLISGLPSIELDRSDAYIGVLIDDLVTKGSTEPYRMMTSRAEYRLLLRQDNADLRLTPVGYEVGLIGEQRYTRFLEKKRLIDTELKRVESVVLAPDTHVNALLSEYASAPITTGIKLSDLIKRPELDYETLGVLDDGRPNLPATVREQVGIQIKYDGYIKRQLLQVQQFKKAERTLIPADIDYNAISGLRIEARQKMSKIQPQSVGQASRIAGVSPADISVLLVYLKRMELKIKRM